MEKSIFKSQNHKHLFSAYAIPTIVLAAANKKKKKLDTAHKELNMTR